MISVPWILGALMFGALFGVATYAHRHLFNEGPTKKDADDDGWRGRVFWVLVCTFLWPLMLLSGGYGLFREQQRRRQPARIRGGAERRR